MYSTQRRFNNIATDSVTVTERCDSTSNKMEVTTSTGLQAVSNSEAKDLRTLAPQSVIVDVVSSVRNPQLRSFLESVLHEPLIHGLITVPLVRPGQPVQFPIQIIRRTANTYSMNYGRTAQEKDLLTVAAVLWGMRSLLPLSIYGDTALQDVFSTLIRSPLHQLDDRTCQVSMLLRSLIGLGDEEGVDESLVHLHTAITQRIRSMHACKPWLLPVMEDAIERQTVRGVLQFAHQANISLLGCNEHAIPG